MRIKLKLNLTSNRMRSSWMSALTTDSNAEMILNSRLLLMMTRKTTSSLRLNFRRKLMLRRRLRLLLKRALPRDATKKILMPTLLPRKLLKKLNWSVKRRILRTSVSVLPSPLVKATSLKIIPLKKRMLTLNTLSRCLLSSEN
jgi:hypothetical protein